MNQHPLSQSEFLIGFCDSLETKCVTLKAAGFDINKDGELVLFDQWREAVAAFKASNWLYVFPLMGATSA